MPVPMYTLEELRHTLQHSAIPSLITEGRTDYTLMRSVAATCGGDCLPAGNKAAVIVVADDPNLFARPQTAFLVDADFWSLDGSPGNRVAQENLIITEGYSIENDLLRDADVEQYLDQNECGPYQRDIDAIVRWFSAGIVARREGMLFDFEQRINTLLGENPGELTPNALAAISHYAPSQDLVDQIRGDYRRILRGKTWSQVLNRYLCANGRLIQHPPLSLMDKGIRSDGPFATRLRTAIVQRLTVAP